MSYIYDIVVNLTNPIIDYFDWNKSDNLTHLRKVPVIKVNTDTLYDLTYNKVRVNMETLFLIKYKIDTKNDNTFIFTDTKTNICIKFKDGINILKSYLQFEIDEEIDEFSFKLSNIKLDYELLEVKKVTNFKTRRENLIESYVIKNIKNLDKNNDIEKLKYIYFDCFNEKCDDKKEIITKINDNLENISDKIYNFLKLTSINK